jgi:phage I-like protein
VASPRNNERIMHLRGDISLSDGKAPSEFRLLRYGVNDSDYGPITFDEIAAAMVMKDFAEKGIPRLFADWNHGMIPDDPDDKPSRADGASCASFVPAVRNGELWATDVQWTDDGRTDVEGRRYNLFSPAFSWEVGGDGQLRPNCLINFALVNRAGLDNIAPLIAATATAIRQQGSLHMEYEKLYQETKLALEAAHIRIKALEGTGAEVMALSAAVGIRPDAASTDRLTAVQGLVTFRGDILKLAGADSVAAAVGTFAQWKDKAVKHDELVVLAAKRDEESLGKELDGALKRYSNELKLPPAEIPHERAAALAFGGGKPSKEGIAYLTARYENAAPRVSGSEVAQREGAAPLPTKTEERMNRLMGVNGDAFVKWQTAQAGQ